jgi:hypothetical protein
MRGEVGRQLPQLSEADLGRIRTTEPRMTGGYDMAGGFGQYFFAWTLDGGAEVRVAYEGSLDQTTGARAKVTLKRIE